MLKMGSLLAKRPHYSYLAKVQQAYLATVGLYAMLACSLNYAWLSQLQDCKLLLYLDVMSYALKLTL